MMPALLVFMLKYQRCVLAAAAVILLLMTIVPGQQCRDAISVDVLCVIRLPRCANSPAGQ